MTVNYTTNLGLGLPVTGTESGLWGDIVNNQITSLIDTAISGTTSVAVTSADVTLTATQGAANQARSMVITLTGASTAARNVICPAVSKIYIVRNDTTGGFAHTFKTTGGTGISVPNGKAMMLYCDGTNVLDAATYLNATVTNLANGSAGTVPYQSAAGTTAMLAAGTAGQVLTSGGAAAPTWSTPSAGFTNIAVITTTSSWTVPAGVTKAKVTVVGGGGGGSGFPAPGPCCGARMARAGGGAGGTATGIVTGLTPASTVTVTVGAGGTGGTGNGGTGGTSSFGVSVSATGGAGGTGTAAVTGVPGAGGAGSAGALLVKGGGGGASDAPYVSGDGGNSSLGAGAPPVALTTSGAGSSGVAGGAYGGGGSGAASLGPNGSALNGGAGGAGVVIIEY